MKGKSEKKEKEWATSYYLSLFNANKPKKYSYLCKGKNLKIKFKHEGF